MNFILCKIRPVYSDKQQYINDDNDKFVYSSLVQQHPVILL